MTPARLRSADHERRGPAVDELTHYAGRVAIAFLLTLPIALEREHTTRMVGLRTLPLVSVACCAFVLLGHGLAARDPTAHARLLSGLIAGIGFIGGGAILKNRHGVRGTETAASILATGVLGAAVGYGRYTLAALIAVATLATLLVLTPLERRLRDAVDERRRDSGP